MPIERIVSFLPSATELLYEFDVADKLFGVTHECKYPEDAKLKPQVISSVINSDNLTSDEINTVTCTLLNQGKNNLQAPWLGITGFISISILLSLLVFIGEAFRDAFDPRKIN